MQRNEMVKQLTAGPECWDIIIVGGGATGLGCAVDSASRGYRTLLLERGDFAKGTSSRSTKLVHGGVRYLEQGNFSLVLEALKERGLLRRNAPHLVSDLPFVVPNYSWWEAPWTGIGLKLYDIMAGKLGFGASRLLSKAETVQRIPTVEQDGLHGGIIYHDGQFDDARLAINLARTAADHGATVLNYANVKELIKEQALIEGVVAEDLETGDLHYLKGKAIINATGPFSDALRRIDDPAAPPLIAPSQGVHIVLDRSFLPGDSAILVPHTRDGRVIFLIPWHDRILVGTTDTALEGVPVEPVPLPDEVDFLLEYAARYLTKDPTRSDVLSVFAGIRPLVRGGDDAGTASLSRDHSITISTSGLITVAGGKWTTYRKMAEDTIDQALVLAELEAKPCNTYNLPVHGSHPNAKTFGALAWYGSDAPGIEVIMQEEERFAEPLHADMKPLAAEVIWAVREEMARTVEDFLARRTRSLLLDARASIDMAPTVARLMAEELGYDEGWQAKQVEDYCRVAGNYVLS
jgi:glycerol-3-phosphate dehydrogenase